MDGHFKVVIGVSFKPSYMLANPNLINGEFSLLFVAYRARESHDRQESRVS